MKKVNLTIGAGALAGITAMALSVPSVSATSKTHNKITIRFMIGDFGSVADKQLMDYLVKPYERTHPWVNIQVQFVPGGQTNVDTKTILAVNSGSPPNIVAVFQDEGALVQKGILTNLSNAYSQSHIVAKDFIPASWDATLVNGVPYAFPATSNPSYGMWYNPQAMKSAGLNPNDPPRTWKQLYQDSVKAVKFNKNGNLIRVGWLFYDYSFGMFEGNFASGDHLWKKVGNTWTPTPLDPQNVTFLTYLRKLANVYGGWAKYSKWLASDQSWNGSVDYLAQGKALFRMGGFWDYLGFDQYSPTFHYAATLLPTQHGLLSEQLNNPTLSWSAAFPKGQSAAELQAAWNFAVWAFYKHSYALELTTNGSTVINQQAKWDQVASESLPSSHAYFKPQFQSFTLPVRYISQYAPNTPIATYYNAQLQNAVDAVLYGKKTPQQALQQVEQNVQTQMLISGQ